MGLTNVHANGIIASSDGRVKAAIEHRKLHIQTLKKKLRSTKAWLSTANKKLKSCTKFYSKKNWIKSKKQLFITFIL